MVRKKPSTHNGKKTKKDKNNKMKVTIDNFRVIKLLGIGAQGQVYMVEKKDGIDAGNIYAMKVFKRSILKADNLVELVQNERLILEKVAGAPYLATMQYAFQSKDFLYLILDLAQGGDLYSLLQRRALTVEELRFYIAEILVAIEELHKHKIIYRDLKLENVMMDDRGHVIVTDFGLSFDIAATATEDFGRFAGTPQYLAAEALDESLIYGYGVDWWAFAVLAHELCTRKIPYNVVFSDEPEEVRDQLLENEIQIHEKITGTLRDLLEKLFVKDPTKRLGYEKGSEEIKAHPFFETVDWAKVYAKETEPPFISRFFDQYDVSHFDEAFTEANVTFEDKSNKIYFSKSFANFDFVAPHLRIDKPLTDDAKKETKKRPRSMDDKIDDKPAKREKKSDSKNPPKAQNQAEKSVENVKKVSVKESLQKGQKAPLKSSKRKQSKVMRMYDKMVIYIKKLPSNHGEIAQIGSRGYVPNNLRPSMIIERNAYMN